MSVSDLDKAVSNKKFEQLFKNNIQFEVPFFQRGYVWEKRHWDQLFNDIEEQILPDIDSLEDVADAEHFFGPIVVLERSSRDTSLHKFLVIDGQQRITTIYLMLAVIKQKIEEKSHQSTKAEKYCRELDKFIINDFGGENTDDYNKLKVLSSKGDRLPTYLLVFNDNNPTTRFLAIDQQLYVPNINKIDALKKYLNKKLSKDYDDVPSLWKLSQILLKSLKIVWIALDEDKDDPQAIFESLNDRGMPLTASELICNYLFKPLIKPNSSDHEELHNLYWLKASRQIDPNGDFEDYLRIHFSVGEKKLIGKGRRIYVHFKNKNKRLDSEKAKNHLEDIKSNIDIYNQIANPLRNKDKDVHISNLLISIKSTRMDACNVFLLALLNAHKYEKIDTDAVISILRETLTLLVRRKMCELATTKYDTLFPNMLSHIVNEPCQEKALKQKIIDEGYFVSNQDFTSALINRPLYRSRDLPFARMVLQEIDKSMQPHGQLPDYSTFETVEHTLPQELTDAWKQHLGEDSTDNDLPTYINTLGNLCLLSGPANSSAGQNPFESKKEGYPDACALTKDMKKREGKWNIQAIKTRGEDLAKKALKIWAWSE